MKECEEGELSISGDQTRPVSAPEARHTHFFTAERWAWESIPCGYQWGAGTVPLDGVLGARFTSALTAWKLKAMREDMAKCELLPEANWDARRPGTPDKGQEVKTAGKNTKLFFSSCESWWSIRGFNLACFLKFLTSFPMVLSYRGQQSSFLPDIRTSSPLLFFLLALST